MAKVVLTVPCFPAIDFCKIRIVSMRCINATASLLVAIIFIAPTLTLAQSVDAGSGKENAVSGTGRVDAPDTEPVRRPFGQFLTVDGQVDDALISRVTSLTRELQTRAVREKRQAILVLEISPGSSRQGQVHDLAKVLVSPELSNVRAVAWIPKTLDGNHAILALACHEIYMTPTAALGDIGRGKALSDVEQNFVLDIVDRGRNLRMSRAIAKGMMEPANAVMRVTLEDANGNIRQQFLSAPELRDLQNQNVAIVQTDTIKDPGQPGIFTGSEAAKAGFLVAATAASRNEVIAELNLPLEAMREEGDHHADVVARVIAINNVVGKQLADFIARETQRAISDGVNMIIYEIDSPGGDKLQAQQVATQIAELDPAKVTTVAWIPREATQAGTLAAFSCDRIFLGDDATIGNVDLKAMRLNNGHRLQPAEDLDADDQQKLLTVIASISKRKNRSLSLLQAMADSTKPVFVVTQKESGRVAWMNDDEIAAQPDEWVKGDAIPEARGGNLLVLNAKRAHELGIAESPCHDMEQLRTRLGISETTDLRPVAKTWVDNLVTALNSRWGGFLLVTIGIIFIYLELHMPAGLYLIGAITSFSLFFWSRFLGGSAGGLELTLFILGMVLLGVEFFVIPGFGVFGVTGILMTVASLVMASNTFSGMSATEGFEQSMNSLGSLAAALMVVIAVAVVMNRFLPSIPFVNRLILTPPGYMQNHGEGVMLDPSLQSQPVSVGPVAVGTIGVTASSLRPTGKAMFGDKYLDVVSDGAYIDHGTKIEVIRLAGNRIIVRSVDGTNAV
jgi:membrane-bound serine protease (ClpP class)